MTTQSSDTTENEYGQVLVEVKDGIAVLTLSQPARRNALSTAMWKELHEQCKALNNDEGVRAIVLRGAGDHFCSGADVKRMHERSPSLLARRSRAGEHTHPLLRLLIGGAKPVVAAVEGCAFGAGMSLALACDYVVAGRGVRLAVAQSRVGLMADLGLLWLLSERVGAFKAREIALFGQEIRADEAKSLHLVNAVVDEGAAFEAALEAAYRYSQLAPLTVAFTKAATAFHAHSLDSTLRCEGEFMPILTGSQDHQEGIAAFRERRKPRFEGR